MLAHIYHLMCCSYPVCVPCFMCRSCAAIKRSKLDEYPWLAISMCSIPTPSRMLFVAICILSLFSVFSFLVVSALVGIIALLIGQTALQSDNLRLSMSLLSRDEARELIADIGIDNGYVSPEDRVLTPANVLRSLASTLRRLAASTST